MQSSMLSEKYKLIKVMTLEAWMGVCACFSVLVEVLRWDDPSSKESLTRMSENDSHFQRLILNRILKRKQLIEMFINTLKLVTIKTQKNGT